MSFNKFDDFFALNFKVFSWAGLRFDFPERSKWHNRFSNMLGVFCISWSILTNVVIILYIAETDAEIIKRLKPFPILLTNVVCLSRVLCVYANYDRFIKILKDLRNYYEFQQEDGTIDKKYLIKNAKIVISYNKVQFVIASFYAASPMIGSVIIYIKTKAWVIRYSLDVWYPYDKTLMKYYLFTYNIEVLIIFVYTIYCGLDTLIMMIITHINHQLQLLSSELTNLTDMSSLNILVDRHCRLTK